MDEKVQHVLDRHRSLKKNRDQWLPLWQELAEMLQPNRGSFTSPMNPGRESQVDIYDTTPRQACKNLATAIDGLLKPATAKWFWLRCQDEEINDLDEAKLWFDDCQRRMWSSIYHPNARFIQHSGAVDYDIATFGFGHLWISENGSRDGLMFRSLHIADVAIDENADGQIDTAYITRRWTARQFIQRFGDKKVPPKVAEALKDQNRSKSNQLFEFVQAIEPRNDYDKGKYTSTNLPFKNCIVSCEDEFLVEENGFHEFPIAIPRWEVTANQIYPRSAGMMALPDARTLNAMGHTLLVGGQRAVDPPKWIANDGILSAVRTFPGGMTVVDAETIRMTGGKPMGTLDSGADIPLGREMQNDYRDMVERAFMKNIFNLPAMDTTERTATEILARKEEFLRTMGPTLGQLEPDYIGVIVSRVFGIMYRAGALPEPPDALRGRNVKFEFMSPVQQARRQLDVAALGRTFEVLTPLVEVQPEVADNIDGDEIARDMPGSLGLPHKWIRPPDQVQARRQERAQAVAGQGAIAEGQGIADIAKTMAEAGNTATNTEQMQQGA